jgi:hypothetical protein
MHKVCDPKEILANKAAKDKLAASLDSLKVDYHVLLAASKNDATIMFHNGDMVSGVIRLVTREKFAIFIEGKMYFYDTCKVAGIEVN